jgi:4-amino-4-deoxy-L-arabinose transferase-like glycosyltransferase
MRRQYILIVVLFITAAGLRFADVFRPINQASWRECDLGAVARNFVREGMDPWMPRIDWRGDGPGYTEMELPLYPFLTALTYQETGIHDDVARVWSFLFSLGAMFFFYKIAREYLNVFPATVAFAFFALNPLMVRIGTSIQPEGIMLLTYLGAVLFFIRWLRTDKIWYYWAAMGSTALTLLNKAPAVHIGVLFGILLLQKYGWRTIQDLRVWLFGIASLGPAFLWYYHAKNLYIAYGNSLGVSNEYHWIGWDFFTDTSFIKGIIGIEFAYVWLVFGAVVGAFAIWQGYRENTARHALLWLASIFAFYVVAARTASEDWAAYYHAFSIAPVALLFGFAIKKLWEYARDFADNYSRRSFVHKAANAAIGIFVIVAVLASLRVEARQDQANFVENHTDSAALTFARRIEPVISDAGLILVSGGHEKDSKGYPVAYNASYMFYWLDRKGWNLPVEQHTLPKLREFALRGANYFIGERQFMRDMPDFEEQARAVYPVLAESENFILLDLRQPK